MKHNLQTIIRTSAASAMVFSVIAQDTPRIRTDQPDATRQQQGQSQSHLQTRTDRINGAAKSTDLIGMAVRNYQDEKLGKVEDLAVDLESGRVVQVILSTGGFLGLGDTLTAVPPGALHHDVVQKVLHLNADKEKLKAAPKFETSKWAEGHNYNHLSTVYRHYGQESTFRFIEQQDEVTGHKRNPQAPGTSDRAQTPRSTDGSQNTVSTRNADGTWSTDRGNSQSQSMIPASRLGHIQQASKLTGQAVRNLQDEKLGDVQNLLVDLPSGRIVAVIVSTGGFLGMGDELSAVPPTALRFTTDRDTLLLDASKEMLTKAPHFKANQWPDFNQTGYSQGIYRAYNVEPYFSTDASDLDNTRRNVRDRDNQTPRSNQPDNSQRNVRDRDDQTLTPFDQGTSKADVDLTAQIRKEITASKNMSVNAQNVKVISKDGRVTLRGPVNTMEEKRLIGEIAERCASGGKVDNQLEVKPTPARQ